MAEAPSLRKILNLRQIGGTGLTNGEGRKMRDGLVFRSARTDSATSADKDHLVKELKIRSIIDLRGDSEYKKRASKPFQDTFTTIFMKNGLAKEQSRPSTTHVGYMYVISVIGRRYALHVMNQVNLFLWLMSFVLIGIDLLFGTKYTIKFYANRVVNKMEVWQHYIDILENAKPEIAEVLRLVSDENNLPCLIHCELGKDRTGYITALILACIGIEDDVIVADYAKTEDQIKPYIDKVIAGMLEKYGADEKYAHAEAETMQMMLNELRKRYGSISNYISSTGFTKQEQNKLKEILLCA